MAGLNIDGNNCKPAPAVAITKKNMIKNNNKNNNWIWKLILLWIFYISSGLILWSFADDKIFKIVGSALIAFFIISYHRIMEERKYGKSRNNDNNIRRNNPGDGNSPGNDTK